MKNKNCARGGTAGATRAAAAAAAAATAAAAAAAAAAAKLCFGLPRGTYVALPAHLQRSVDKPRTNPQTLNPEP
jgi:hypothetical protein